MAAAQHPSRSFRVFDQPSRSKETGWHRWMRGDRFVAEFVCASGPHDFTVESPQELLLLLPDAGATIRAFGDVITVARGNSSCILPAGQHAVRLAGAGHCAVLATTRPEVDPSQLVNAADYDSALSRTTAVGPARRRRGDARAVRVFDMTAVAAPGEKSRLKFLQTESMSINWVNYEGPRDRTQLTPHNHAHFEQGSLALRGNFVHHLRLPWGPDANLWQDDEHLEAPSPSLVIVPPDVIHTTEGVGGEDHLLIDIFSPVREDFIAKGWVFNADDYEIVA